MRFPNDRKYINQLARWAQDPENREHINLVCGPLQSEIIKWMTGIITRYYYSELKEKFGVDRKDFEQNCLAKLYGFLHRNPLRLQDKSMTDQKFEFLLRRLARSTAIDIRRLKYSFYIKGMMDFSKLEQHFPSNEERLSSDVDPHLVFLNSWPALQRELAHLPPVMQSFFKSLRKRNKTNYYRRVAAVILAYCRNEMERTQEFCFWLMAWILLQRQRLYDDLQAWLRRHFPEKQYKAICAHLSQLRHKFEMYLKENGIYDWLKWLVSGFAEGTEPPARPAF